MQYYAVTLKHGGERRWQSIACLGGCDENNSDNDTPWDYDYPFICPGVPSYFIETTDRAEQQKPAVRIVTRVTCVLTCVIWLSIWRYILRLELKIFWRGASPLPDLTPNENNENLKLFKTLTFKATRSILAQKDNSYFSRNKQICFESNASWKKYAICHGFTRETERMSNGKLANSSCG